MSAFFTVHPPQCCVSRPVASLGARGPGNTRPVSKKHVSHPNLAKQSAQATSLASTWEDSPYRQAIRSLRYLPHLKETQQP